MTDILVTIDPATKDKLDAYIDIASGEISGLGTVVQPKRGEFHIQEVHLFEQTCSGSSTDISSEDVAKSLVQALNMGLDPFLLKLWWHSHANMQAFWSGTDHSTARALDNGSNQWMLCLVQNKRGEYKLRLDVYDPTYIYIDNIPLKVLPRDNPLRNALVEEVRSKVKAHTPPVSSVANYVPHGNYHTDKHAPGYWDKEKTVWNKDVAEWEYPPGHTLECLNKSWVKEDKKEIIQHGLKGLDIDTLTEEEMKRMSKEEREWYNSALGDTLYPSDISKLSKRQIKRLRRKGIIQ
jgi:hypothetical protein